MFIYGSLNHAGGGAMDTAQRAKYRERLLARQRECLPALGMKFDAVARQGRVAEEDQVVISHDEFISVRLNRLEWQNLRRIEAALERLDRDEYGVCEECGEAISSKRLDAIPWALLCVSCQERAREEEVDEDGGLLEPLIHRN
jgi:DnaK suppressor protein